MTDKLNEQSGVLLQGHIKIHNPETGEVIVDKRNAIHYENMSISLAESLGNAGTGWIYEMGFGNGGTSVDPTGIITYLTPNSWHYPVKRFFFNSKMGDTFPVEYKMNTRADLKNIFESYGFHEECFLHLDDLALFSRFRNLNLIELWLWKMFKFLGLRYPENNLLGVYRKL